MLLDWCIALGCLAACFAGGWAFVSARLLQNFDDKETGVQVTGLFESWYFSTRCGTQQPAMRSSRAGLVVLLCQTHTLSNALGHSRCSGGVYSCLFIGAGIQQQQALADVGPIAVMSCHADPLVLHFCLLLQPAAAGGV